MTAIEDFEKRMGITKVEFNHSTELPNKKVILSKSRRELHDSLPISFPRDIQTAIMNKTFVNNQGTPISLTVDKLSKLTNLLEAAKQMYYDKKDSQLAELACETFKEFNKRECNIVVLTNYLNDMRTIITNKMIGGCVDGN